VTVRRRQATAPTLGPLEVGDPSTELMVALGR
jgi:hypothetical protein